MLVMISLTVEFGWRLGKSRSLNCRYIPTTRNSSLSDMRSFLDEVTPVQFGSRTDWFYGD